MCFSQVGSGRARLSLCDEVTERVPFGPSPPLASSWVPSLGSGLLPCELPYGEAHGAGNPASANLEASPHEVTQPSQRLHHEDPTELVHRNGRW